MSDPVFEGLSPHTRRAYQRVWTELRTRAAMEGVKWESADSGVAARWWREMTAGKKPATQAQLRAALRFCYAGQAGNPFADLPIDVAGGDAGGPSATETGPVLTPAQVGAVLRELDRAGERGFGPAQSACLAALLYVTGWRFAELVALRIPDLTHAGSQVTGWNRVRSAATAGAGPGKGRGGKAVAVSLPAAVGGQMAGFLRLREAVIARSARRSTHGLDRLRSDLVFANERGGPLPAETFNRHLRAACRAAGVPLTSAHGLRQAAAAAALRDEGRPLKEVQRLLGHHSVRTTRRALSALGWPGPAGARPVAPPAAGLAAFPAFPSGV